MKLANNPVSSAGLHEEQLVKTTRDFKNRLHVLFEERAHPSRFWQFGAIPVAILLAFLTTSLLITAAGADVWVAAMSLVDGAFGGKSEIIESLVRSTPLIFTGVAVAVALKGGLVNLGADGQMMAGAMGAYLVVTTLQHAPTVVIIIGVTLASILFGALWGFIPGILRAKYGANVLITSVLSSYIAQYVLSYLLSGPWRDPASYLVRSALIPETAHFPRLIEGQRLDLGFLLAIATAVLVFIMLKYTPLGYRIRVVGSNEEAAKHQGIKPDVIAMQLMLISGGIAGLAGGSALTGLHFRLQPNFTGGVGYMGFVIARLGGLNPLGSVISGVLFGALLNGSVRVQVATGMH
jgi:general nucleoside transport system permease protein